MRDGDEWTSFDRSEQKEEHSRLGIVAQPGRAHDLSSGWLAKCMNEEARGALFGSLLVDTNREGYAYFSCCV